MKISKEKRWVLIFATLVMVLTTVPYLIAYARQGSDWQFTGFLFGVEDGNSYIAKMLEGSKGAWLFQTPYTTFPQQGILAFLPYLLLGKLAAGAGLHEQLVVLFHLFRIGAGILAILATYDFIALVVKSETNRRVGTAVASLGGGLGWVLVAVGATPWLGTQPLDFYSPETFGFLELFGLPHLALARACLLWGLVAFLAPEREYWQRRPATGGLFFLAAGLLQPLTTLVGWIAIGWFLGLAAVPQMIEMWRRKPHDWLPWTQQARNAMWTIGISCPVILYNGFISFTDPFMRGWTIQNIITSPHPLHYFVAFGLIAPLSVMGLRSLWMTRRNLAIFLGGWLLLFPILAYAPVSIQRRLPEGVWVAWVTLAMAFFDDFAGRGKRWLRYGLLACAPSTLFLLTGSILVTIRPTIPLYRPTGEMKAIAALGAHVTNNDVVLGSYATGNVLPAWVGVRVIAGHGPESIGLKQRLPEIEAVFDSNTSDRDRLAYLQENDVRYLFWGPEERKLGSWDPHQAVYLTDVYDDRDGYAVYEVTGVINE